MLKKINLVFLFLILSIFIYYCTEAVETTTTTTTTLIHHGVWKTDYTFNSTNYGVILELKPNDTFRAFSYQAPPFITYGNYTMNTNEDELSLRIMGVKNIEEDCAASAMWVNNFLTFTHLTNVVVTETNMSGIDESNVTYDFTREDHFPTYTEMTYDKTKLIITIRYVNDDKNGKLAIAGLENYTREYPFSFNRIIDNEAVVIVHITNSIFGENNIIQENIYGAIMPTDNISLLLPEGTLMGYAGNPPEEQLILKNGNNEYLIEGPFFSM